MKRLLSSSSLIRRHWSAVVVLVTATLAMLPVLTSGSNERLLWQAGHAFWIRDFVKAEQLANVVLANNPDCYAAAAIAGDAACGRHDHEAAIEYYGRIPWDGSPASLRAGFGLGERYRILGSLKQAEHCLRFVLQQRPTDFQSNRLMAFVLQVQGRTWEAVPHAMKMIRSGIFGSTEIHMVACPENRLLQDERFLKLCENNFPNEAGAKLATARLAALQNETKAAEELFRRVISLDSDLAEAHVRLGRILLNSGRDDSFADLNARAPQTAEEHSGVWLNRSMWATKNGQDLAAARCLYEAVRRAPNLVEANYGLSQSFTKMGNLPAAEVFGIRAKTLARIEITIPEFYDSPTTDRMQALIRDLRALGRNWEAAAICSYAMNLDVVAPPWAVSEMSNVARLLRTNVATLMPPEPTKFLAELSELPLPDWRDSRSTGPTSLPAHESSVQISFVDRAAETGLDFTYFNGSIQTRGMEHIFETTGGGMAALDYDGDLSPDLYLAQGAPLWKGDDQVTRKDCLFRNLRDSFQNVSTLAGLGDERFSQGVTAGDYNNDGFDDIYVGNLGGNRLYRNNGDGTFSETTIEAGVGGDEWTTSSMLADLNGDSLPDLYVVNYLKREEVFDRRCKRDGQPLTCAPTMFPAEQDRVYLNSGNGTFEEVTHTCGIVQAEGKGLAIAAGDFDGTGRLSVFVGNDTTPNFFFGNRHGEDGSLFLEESGIISGLAVDGSGRSQATMGIACGDVDGSGLIDLFITNFYNDANTLYLQPNQASFVDATRTAELYEPSFAMLGFGTEFLDADLDGDLDLFVTNGHVDRSFATGEPDEMPPQFFRNDGTVRFAELTDPTPGKYFDGKYLGRTVARLDWNRDGRDDLCVLHLYAPIALVTNVTTECGNFVGVRIRGTVDSRDAVGTSVQFQTDRRTLTQQLTAGDGYLVRNERRMTFGLGSDEKPTEITVTWPNGQQQTFHNISPGQEILLVQSRKEPYWTPN
ncbi:MAG: FG-GAP-like repeat-containing protein [Fuerstiella sp.]